MPRRWFKLLWQVCALVWSPEYKELVSAHGYANNEVIIWKYPGMVKTAELLGHTDRVLNLSLSADQTTVVRNNTCPFPEWATEINFLLSFVLNFLVTRLGAISDQVIAFCAYLIQKHRLHSNQEWPPNLFCLNSSSTTYNKFQQKYKFLFITTHQKVQKTFLQSGAWNFTAAFKSKRSWV